jgi:hypothetical protein
LCAIVALDHPNISYLLWNLDKVLIKKRVVASGNLKVKRRGKNNELSAKDYIANCTIYICNYQSSQAFLHPSAARKAPAAHTMLHQLTRQ